jgi:hypothetical protein
VCDVGYLSSDEGGMVHFKDMMSDGYGDGVGWQERLFFATGRYRRSVSYFCSFNADDSYLSEDET